MTVEKVKNDKEFEFSDDDFAFVVSRVYQDTGIKLAEHKRNMVYSRLARRLRELKFKTFKQYINYLESADGKHELGKFVNAITTNLTGFFREPHHFTDLKEVLQKRQEQPGSSKRLRIWSAACSSGPEAYSVAMIIKETLTNLAAWDAKILATDIDTNMLEIAKLGEYEKRLVEKIPDDYQRKFAVGKQSSNLFTMADSLKSLITFKQLNLLHHWPMKGPFDVIFCRNVVIYFDKETQQKLFDRMANLLVPGGILYIGHSESLFGISERFELVGKTKYIKIE